MIKLFFSTQMVRSGMAKVPCLRSIASNMAVYSTKTAIINSIFLHERSMAHGCYYIRFFTFYINFWWIKVVACLNLPEIGHFRIMIALNIEGNKWKRFISDASELSSAQLGFSSSLRVFSSARLVRFLSQLALQIWARTSQNWPFRQTRPKKYKHYHYSLIILSKSNIL